MREVRWVGLGHFSDAEELFGYVSHLADRLNALSRLSKAFGRQDFTSTVVFERSAFAVFLESACLGLDLGSMTAPFFALEARE
jgi:hypothetical protein